MDNISSRRIVIVGSYGVGLSVTLDVVPRGGQTVIGRTFSVGHGGKGSNQAVAAARLGADVALYTVVGSDSFGDGARLLWADEGVDASAVHTLEGSTMVGVILVEANGENRIAIVPGVLDDFEPIHLDADGAIGRADVVVVGLEIPVATAHAALELARRSGATTILNPAPAPAAALPAAMMRLVDHLIPNRTEAAALAGADDDGEPDIIARALALESSATVVLTLGGDGALVVSDGTVTAVPAIRVAVTDTTGAGDSFTGAYAVAIACGHTPVDAARFAVRAAAHSVTISDVIPSLPRLADIERLPAGAST